MAYHYEPQTLQSRKRVPHVPATPWAFIKYVVRHCSARMKWLAAVTLVFMAIATVLDVLTTWVLGRIVGAVIDNQHGDVWAAATPELWRLFILWTVRNIALRGAEWTQRNHEPDLMNQTMALLFNRLIQQSQGFLHSNFAGVLANHVRRAGDVMGSLRDRMQNNIIPLLLRFGTASLLLWQITPQLTYFLLAFIVFFIAVGFKVAPHWAKLSEANAEAASRLSGYVIDGITNLSTVQQNVGMFEEQRRLDAAIGRSCETYWARRVFRSKFWFFFDSVSTLFFTGFMALTIYGWQHGHVTTAQLAMTVGLVGTLFGALAATLDLLSTKFDDIGVLADALRKISTPMTVLDAPNAPDLNIAKGAIEFRNVDFSYGADKSVFANLNLSIAAGQKVGFVGVSGAGKTTLCQLLLRAYDVTGGGIYVDGQNIAQVTQDSLHAAIAVIPQDPALFHRSLGDNIRYGRLGATDADIATAAQAAEAATFIERLPLGYNTLVGERGVKLSGGQRQRVAIARAIVKNAPILVLDEATSALDSETEKSIQAAMLHAMEGRTTLVVAHRLSTLSHMDRIVVMEHGCVVEDGSFSQLLSLNGVFARLWHLQAGGFLPENLPVDNSTSH